jgi:hypothetical protein
MAHWRQRRHQNCRGTKARRFDRDLIERAPAASEGFFVGRQHGAVAAGDAEQRNEALASCR